MSGLYIRYVFPTVTARDAQVYRSLDVFNVVEVLSPAARYLITAVTAGVATFMLLADPTASGSDNGVFTPDVPPDTPSDWDDEFDAGSLDAKWGIWNPSGSLVTGIVNNHVYLEPASTGVEGIYQAVPSDDFAVYSKVSLIRDNSAAGVGRVGLFLADDIVNNPTTADAYTVGLQCSTAGAGQFATQALSWAHTASWTKWDTVNSYVNSVEAGTTHLYIRMRVVASGGSVDLDVSSDGVGWTCIDSSAAVGFTPLYFGIWGYQFASAGRAMAKFFRVFDGTGKADLFATSIGAMT